MPIRTAILGYGRSGSTLHAGPIEKLDDFEMVAACDIDPQRRKQARERFGCAVYEDYHKMLADEDLDLVVIVTLSYQHCEMACDCLRAGANVLVTKPWCVSADEARRMIAAADEGGRMLMPWLPARWGSDIKRLRELMAEQAVGRPFLVRRCVSSFATRCDWQTESRYGGGYILNWGPHVVDTPVNLMGRRVKSVYARTKQVINPGDVEDMFLALMNLEDGTLVQAEYAVTVEQPPTWFIQGDRGTIVVRGRELKVYKRTPPQPTDPTKYGTMVPEEDEVLEETVASTIYGDEFEVYSHLARALRGEEPLRDTHEDALELSRVLDAVRTSGKEDRVISL
jgi:predicted dehydrogenase